MNRDEDKDLVLPDRIDKNANLIETDFRAEMFAAGLMEDGYNRERIQIIRQGGARRGFSKDIEEVRINWSANDLRDYLQIKVNKDSIYDILPEGFFHRSKHRRFNPDKEEVIDEIREHRLEEFYARKFFQPFEVEIDHALVLASLYEIQYEKKINNNNYTDIFNVYWPVLKLLKPIQRVHFMHTIPFLYRIRNNHDEIEKTMANLLEVPVKIENIKLPAKNADRFFESALGKSRINIDLVLGKAFDDGQYDLKVTVGPISAKKMEYFLETSTGNTILDFLCLLFFPGDTFVVKEFKIFPEDAAFVMSDEKTTSFLGINTFI